MIQKIEVAVKKVYYVSFAADSNVFAANIINFRRGLNKKAQGASLTEGYCVRRYAFSVQLYDSAA